MYGIVLGQMKSKFLPDHRCKQPYCDPVPARSGRNTANLQLSHKQGSDLKVLCFIS